MSHDRYRKCIQACYSCAAACDHCATACLAEDNVAAMENCIRTDIDCADICRLAAAAMARGSASASDICRLCADICDRCAAECGKHDHDHCQACAKACRDCGEECRAMAA